MKKYTRLIDQYSNMVDYFVTTIHYHPHEPNACMECGKNNFVRNVVIAMTGPTPQNVSPKDSILCLDCETLMVITDEQRQALSLGVANPGQDKVTLKHSGAAK